MRKTMILSLVVTLFLFINTGCSKSPPNDENAPGAAVKPEEAQKLAIDKFNLKKIVSHELRLLTEKERTHLTDAQKNLTPVYYVIKGDNNEGKEVTVYISSNSIKDYFTIP
ncbi:hypothetical protein [Paenibacillus ehimensis]|uniref:Lipoprotein n=1 Tax=Paenibacillus ehimensis TaxID=79264 RepID=A0ABT8VFS3_9BACL|nr:hypothetical protein [Paenibacillus ehimensis]MDO3679822.1 hypothetical protein [Paenibacillus ehimensis]MEC0211371.1 hypothetical protein [Paenibacillus ehimensis]